MLGRLLAGAGATALRWPAAATLTYGIPARDEDAFAYVRATAARDLVMGAFVLWAAVAGDRRALAAGLLACIAAPAADLALAYARSGVVGVAGAWAVVRAGR